jgi:hypothetical protein
LSAAAFCQRLGLGWEIESNVLMLHGHFSPWLGEKLRVINEGQMPLNQRVPGSNPGAPTKSADKSMVYSVVGF